MATLDIAEDSLKLCYFIQRLADQQLITGSEQDQINAKENLNDKKSMIFDLLKEKNWMESVKILQELKCNYSDNSCTNKIFLKENKNPLEIDLVIRCIYGYLNLDGIKICRQMNKRWNKISAPILEKRCKIMFKSYLQYNIGKFSLNPYFNMRPSNFLQTFSKSQVEINFTAFEFVGKWSIAELTRFFEQDQGKSVQEWSFTDTNLKKKNNENFVPFDISTLITGSKLRKLDIWYPNHDYACKLCVSLDSLNSLQYLKLQWCDVVIIGTSKIHPIEVHVNSVNFYKGRNKLEQFLINEVMEFDKAEKLQLYCNPQGFSLSGETTIALDVSEANILDSVDLSGVVVINMAISEWTVNKMKLDGIPFKGFNSMQVKNLEFTNGEIDLYGLSQKIETLNIRKSVDRETNVCCSGPIFLPNLRKLNLARVASSYTHFSECKNITDIVLDNLLEEDFELEADSLPKRLKKLKLNDIDINKGEITFKLDKLILVGYNFIQVDDILEFLRPKVLALHWSPEGSYELNESVFSFVHKNRKTIQNTIVGPFQFDTTDETEFDLQCDIRARFYSFNNDAESGGKGISSEDEIVSLFQL